MRRDHEDAVSRMKKLLEQEIETVTQTQAHTRLYDYSTLITLLCDVVFAFQ